MGHYRSEMGYDEQYRKEAEVKAKRLAETTLSIQEAIDRDGVASVLARIIHDAADSHTWIGCRYRR